MTGFQFFSKQAVRYLFTFLLLLTFQLPSKAQARATDAQENEYILEENVLYRSREEATEDAHYYIYLSFK